MFVRRRVGLPHQRSEENADEEDKTGRRNRRQPFRRRGHTRSSTHSRRWCSTYRETDPARTAPVAQGRGRGGRQRRRLTKREKTGPRRRGSAIVDRGGPHQGSVTVFQRPKMMFLP